MGPLGTTAPPLTSVIKIFEKTKRTTQTEIYFETIHLALVFGFWSNLFNLKCDLYVHNLWNLIQKYVAATCNTSDQTEGRSAFQSREMDALCISIQRTWRVTAPPATSASCLWNSIHLLLKVDPVCKDINCKHDAIFTARNVAERGSAKASCPPVRRSVCNVEVSWSYRLEFCENNFTAD